MARTVAELPSGPRITDHISLGVIARTFPLSKVRSALAAEVLIDDDDIGKRVVHLHDLKRILGLIGGHDWTKAICCSLGAISGFGQVFPLPGIDPK